MPAIPFARAALLACLLAATPAVADQTDSRLPALFEQLLTVGDADTAAAVEAQIWGIWSESGDETVDGLMAVGSAALVEQDREKALAAFDRVTQLAPKFAEGWNKRATVLYMLGRIEESEADIAKVLALEPRHFGALSGLGLCETQRDRLPEAVAAFKRALAVDPNLPGTIDHIRQLQSEIAKRSI